MAGKQLKLYVSFKEKEKDLFNHVRNKRDYSAYIKDLIELDMQKSIECGVNEYVNQPTHTSVGSNSDNDLGFDF